MHKKRLLKLADLLEHDAKNKKGIRFDIGWWGHVGDTKINDGVNCGTTACAMGLAVVSGIFKRAGLKGPDWLGSLHPRLGRLSAMAAAAKLFDIPLREANWLFGPHSYDTHSSEGASGERAVAKRIRAFVAGREKAPTL